eukprot:GHVT01032010.1.p1 GENE.GHVT01032010.1~~GHVT01032010.1.p1  ORF type:complete len:371 (+),score=29.67 GHVT01032010.1:206-1318(+)
MRVTADVYAGLDQVTKVRQRDNVLFTATFVRPPKGYPYSSTPFPLKALTVTDKARSRLKALRGAKASTSLARLAQRMLDRWTKSPPVFSSVDCSSDREEATSGNRDDEAASQKKKRRTETEYWTMDSTSGESSQEIPLPVRMMESSRPSCSQASYEPEMEEVSHKLQATALHSEEGVSRGRGYPKEKFNLRITLNPKVTRSHVRKALEEARGEDDVEDEGKSDHDLEVAVDPAASCIRSLDAARESAVLIQEQVQRGRTREGALRKQLQEAERSEAAIREQLRQAEDTVATLERLKCTEADRDVLKRHLDKTVAAQKKSETATPEVQPVSLTSTAGSPSQRELRCDRWWRTWSSVRQQRLIEGKRQSDSP